MKITRYFLCGILVIFCSTSSGLAAQFLFTPRTSATEEYTDNLFLTKDDKEDDFITTVSAGFTAQLLGQTSGFELSNGSGLCFLPGFQ
jgi:hypothetical protein